MNSKFQKGFYNLLKFVVKLLNNGKQTFCNVIFLTHHLKNYITKFYYQFQCFYLNVSVYLTGSFISGILTQKLDTCFVFHIHNYHNANKLKTYSMVNPVQLIMYIQDFSEISMNVQIWQEICKRGTKKWCVKILDCLR